MMVILLGALVLWTGTARSETTREMDRKAMEYYGNKEFGKALAEWLRILELEPENEAIQKKIELLYEEKHRKDLAYQMARFLYRKTREELPTDIHKAKSDSDEAVKNFFIAYHIDPKDPDLQIMKEDMRRLKEEVDLEFAKARLSEKMKRRYLALLEHADKSMKAQAFEDAISDYKQILKFFPSDDVALDGLRSAELAIQNRLKYERILALLAAGRGLFEEKKYKQSRLEFEQVLDLDSRNGEARRYIKRIDDLVEDARSIELKRIQAEQFYLSGIDNVRKRDYDQATDDFENVLSLIANYKDTKERLAAIPGLKKEYAEERRLLRLKDIDKQFQNGLLAYADGRFKEALSFFEKTLTLDPGNDLARRYIARVKEALRDLEEEEVDQDSPYYDIVTSLAVSGRQLFQKGDYTGSRQRWDRILRLFPKNRIALEYLLRCEIKLNPAIFKEVAGGIIAEGKDLLRVRKFDRALRKFEIIASAAPDYPDIANLIMQAKRGVERGTDAGVAPGEIEARYNTAMNLYTRGGKENVQRALEQFKWIIARDPNNVKTLISINRIESQLRIGGASLAEEKGRLTERQQQLVRTYYYNGINYYTNNNFERAIGEWRKVLAIDPTHEKARNNIRKCLVLLGR